VISDATLGALCALGSALTWAVTSLLVRSIIPRFGSVGINAVRSSIGGVLLLGCVSVLDGPRTLVTMSVPTFVLLALSIVAAINIGDTVFFESTRAIGLARAMTIGTTYPVLAAVAAVLVLGETLTWRVATGIVVTLAGLALIVAGHGDEGRPRHLWLGVAAAVLASLSWAASVVLMKAPLREIAPLTAQAIRLPMAAVLLWLTPWARDAVPRLRDGGRGPLARLAVLGVLSAGSSVLFAAGLKYAGVTIGAMLSSTAPLFAIPLGVIFVGERVSVPTIVGAGLAVAGIVVLQA
jgi:drug/metabolite transporter (DMT)-like permease